MAYIGTPPADRFVASKAASVYSGDGSTTAFTLQHSVGSDEDILVSVDGVIQEPSVAYAVSGGTTLTFTAAPSSNSGNNIFVYYLFRTVGTVGHPSNQALSATSGTFTGDLIVDTTSLIVDASSNKIGMGVDPSTMPSFATHSIKTANGGGVSITSPSSGDNRYIFFGNGTSSSDIQLAAIKNTSSNLSFLGASGQVQMVIDSTGAVTKPLQPAFLVKPTSQQNNLAVNDVLVFGTEIFDQNGDFANNTFTAPVTGKYQISAQLRIDNLDKSASYSRVYMESSNGFYESIFDVNDLSADPAYWMLNINILADMDANDTLFMKWSQGGGGANQALLTTPSRFSGYLVC